MEEEEKEEEEVVLTAAATTTTSRKTGIGALFSFIDTEILIINEVTAV